jgi:cellulose synthase/poly-beta-1,6-N-acetylglucosamine synthase-like glycosyltransferase
MMLEIIFWVALWMLLYTYAGYPAVIALLSRLRPRPVREGPIRPTVSLLIVAHNEASVIRRKLDNCLALDYPRDKLELVLASDGSTDRTVEIAREYAGQGVSVVHFATRRGKPSVLNAVIPTCTGDILVLGDARQIYDRDALLSLVANFADPLVGAASGELHLVEPTAAAVSSGVGFYWRHEKFIRRHESRVDSTVGATGAIYALRRSCFEPIPPDTLLDDVLIPMRIVRRGYRVVFEPRAKAFDRAAQTAREEFTRKVRTIGGTLQLLVRERWLWSPAANRLWVQTISHKFLRILGPFLLLATLAASASLAASSPFYRMALAGQLLFYASALPGFLLGRTPGVARWLSIPYAFCMLNLTTVISVIRFLAGGQAITWTRAAEVAGSEPQPVEHGSHTGSR